MNTPAWATSVARHAETQIGVREAKTNRTMYGKTLGLDGVAWCAIFASWCYLQVFGKKTPLAKFQLALGFAGTQLGWRVAQKKGWTSMVPRVGAIVIWRHTATTGHAGIVTSVGNDGRSYVSVEGNTDQSFSRTGGMVGRHNHTVGDGKHTKLLGFIYPDPATVAKALAK